MNSAVLPAPLHLAVIAARSLSTPQAALNLSAFLTNDAPSVLAGTGGAAATRASLNRLMQGFADERLLSQKHPTPHQEISLDSAPAPTAPKDKTKKRKKGDTIKEGSKKRKVQQV